MAEVGILREDDRVALIRREIVQVSPPGRRHAAFVGSLTQLLAVRLAGRALVWVQNPVVLTSDTEPQPDLAVLRRRPVPYKQREAHAEDVLLLIEVADSSLAYDRSTKRRLYAEAGIPSTGWSTAPRSPSRSTGDPAPKGIATSAGSWAPRRSRCRAFPDVELMTTEIFA